MTQSILQSALRLSKAERILLAERLWDSIADDDVSISLTKAQQAELDRRLRRLEETGPQGSGWATVKARVTGRGRT